MADALDLAKFHLDASKASVQARIDLMKAYADFNFRMMEVAEKQAQVEGQHIENDIQRQRLKRLIDAFRDYRLARRESMKARDRAEKEGARVELNARRMATLLLGETLHANDVPRAWHGIEYFVKTADAATIVQLTAVKAAAASLRGPHFSKNRTPDKPCEDAPSSITHAWPLMQWARKKLYLPRIGAPPYTLLTKLIGILGRAADLKRVGLAKQLAALQKELAAIREKGWKQLDIESHAPKKPTDET